MSTYLLSQILVFIATIFIGATYLVKDKKTITLLCVIYCIFYAGHYLLLGAFTGFIMTVISAFRNILFYKNAVEKKDNSFGILFLFIFIAIVSGIFTFQDYFSIISIVASCISTYSIWQKDNKKYRLFAIPVSCCFIIYGVHINSIISIITETILLLIEILGVIIYLLNNFKEREKYIIMMEENYD
jgi:hypothetical protein